MRWLVAGGYLLLLTGAMGVETMRVDDFSTDTLDGWSSSTPAVFRRDEPDQRPFRRVETPGGMALRAVFGFGDPTENEPLFITRRLDPPEPRLPIKRVRFDYRFEAAEPAGATVAPLASNGFIVRLRTSPTEHTNYEVPRPDEGYPLDRWVSVDLEVDALGPKVRNVYGSLIKPGEPPAVRELTFRLDDIDNLNARGALWLRNIRFVIDDSHRPRDYTPTLSDRRPGAHLKVLNLVHSGDGFYDIEAAAKLADPAAEVTTSRFRGLHFPLWEFPASRGELLGYDVIVLADVDPWVLTADQLEWLADAVRSGVGLLVTTGPNSFAHAMIHPAPLLDLLPFRYQPEAEPVKVNAAPVAIGAAEPLAGLDADSLGVVRLVEAITPKPGAEVLLSAGEQPLLLATSVDRGRVIALNSWAQPATVGDGSFLTTPAWPAFAAHLLAWLGHRPLPPLSPSVEPAETLDARWLYERSAFTPGQRFGILVSPPKGWTGNITASLRAGEQEVWSNIAEAGETVTVTGTLPDLCAGPLTAVVTAGDHTATLHGVVVDPVRHEDFYPIISYLPTIGGGHTFDAEATDTLVEEVAAHGFNTLAQGNMGGNVTGGWTTMLRGRAIETGTRLGLANILEYTNFTMYRRGKAFAASPFDPAFKEALRDKLAAGMDQSRYDARLLSVKFVDEPTMAPVNLDDSEATREAFAKLHRRAFMPRDQLSDEPAARYAYGRFLSQYLQQDFGIGQQIKTEAGMPWDLIVTYYYGGHGSCRPLDDFQDAWHWAMPADQFDFDVYPYFYPTSDRLRFVQANWPFAAERVMSREFGKPWGYYCEIDDRNYPYQTNPPEATAECAFTAVAAGANYLNSFVLRTFGSGTGSRPERWELAGQAFRAIRDIGPLLNRWPRQPARVAVLWPETQQILKNGYRPPIYTLSLLAQATGDAEVVHEDLLANGLPETIDVLVLIEVDHLRREAGGGLAAFVNRGGTVLTTRVPSRDEFGRPLPMLDGIGLSPLPELTEEASVEAVEGSDETAWPARLEWLRQRLLPALKPHPGVVGIDVRENWQQTDLGIRHDGESAGLFVVNHDPAPQTIVAQLDNLPFEPGWVVDLTSGEDVTDRLRHGVLTVQVRSRWAAMLGVYPVKPTELELTVPPLVDRSDLRIRMRLLANARPVPGVHRLKLTVTDPNGTVHDRFGGATATEGGMRELNVRVPVNAPGGAWTVVAEAPDAELAATGSFTLR